MRRSLSDLTIRIWSVRNTILPSKCSNTYLAMLFALCLAQIDRRSAPDCTPSGIVIYHRGNALRMLRQALVQPDAEVEDAILFTVVALLAFDMIYMDWTSFEAHLKGLRQLIK